MMSSETHEMTSQQNMEITGKYQILLMAPNGALFEFHGSLCVTRVSRLHAVNKGRIDDL